MSKPIVFLVDEDPETLPVLTAALERRFGADYEILGDGSPESALAKLQQACATGECVALLMASDLDWLARAHDACPGAARCVIASFGDQAAYVRIRRALVLGEVETSVVKLWGHPEERLYPVVSEMLRRWVRVTKKPDPLVRIVGEQWSSRSHDLRDVFERHSLPYAFIAHDSDEGKRVLKELGQPQGLPVVIFRNRFLVDPTNMQIAKMLGVRTEPEGGLYDVVVVGGGPAGLSTAVNAVWDGLRTLVVERKSLGGQAGMSSMIRNYLGFPRGISGADLAARAHEQAVALGAEFLLTRDAIHLEEHGDEKILELAEGTEVRARTVVIASGVSYNRLEVDGIERLAGKGVYYGASTAEARAFAGADVFVVGAGDSGGQAAIHLSRYAATVTMLARGGITMSTYLRRQIERTPNIRIRLNTELTGIEGMQRLEAIDVVDTTTGVKERLMGSAMFVLIGAAPHTSWLETALELSRTGHLLTAPSLETSMPGVFAVGDVRDRSPRGVSAAVADGALVIRSIREHLGDRSRQPAPRPCVMETVTA